MDEKSLKRLQEAVNEYSSLEHTEENRDQIQNLLYEIAAIPNEELEKAVQKYKSNSKNQE